MPENLNIDSAMEQLRADFIGPQSPDDFTAMRERFIEHVVSEMSGDIDGILETLTEDCVYTHRPSGRTWHGHSGAREFYEELYGAFPALEQDWFDHDFVAGPTGILNAPELKCRQTAPFLGLGEAGDDAHIQFVIKFGWSPAAGLFTGETLHLIVPQATYEAF